MPQKMVLCFETNSLTQRVKDGIQGVPLGPMDTSQYSDPRREAPKGRGAYREVE